MARSNGKLPRLSPEAFRAAPPLATREVVLERLGGSVVVQSFTKATHLRLQAEAGKKPDGDMDEVALERLMFRYGVVEPEMTDELVEFAFENWDAADVNTVLVAIAEVCGFADEVRDMKVRFPAGSGEALPVSAGA